MNKKFAVLIISLLSVFLLGRTVLAETIMQGDGMFTFTNEDGVLTKVSCFSKSVDPGPATSADIAALIACAEKQIGMISEGDMKIIKAALKVRQRAEWWDNMKEELKKSMAGAFKQSLESMARSIGHDTAVWVASGGKGQKPLFITEGWGAYVQNAADVALGDFIDQVGKSFGVDMCEPNLNVKLSIMVGIDYRQPRQVRCSFSKMMTNWQSAISDKNFAFEYQAALRPGENDISVGLMLADKQAIAISTAKEKAGKEAEIPGLWTDIKNTAGKILTPGTMIHDKFSKDTNETSKLGWDTFTGTVWDLLGSFLDTLVGQLAINLQSGFFSSGDRSVDPTMPQLPNLAALFNPNASPVVSSVSGAENKFKALKTNSLKVGGRYEIVAKLTTCPDPNNPGPTDCVLDQSFADAIRKGMLVDDLPVDILNRSFAPKVNGAENPKDQITYRAITILRKYRIVPVGWEVAAQRLREPTENRTFTLGQLKDLFYTNDPKFGGLVDPYWILKASEMFCRREGYGPLNTRADEQDQSTDRADYCADEQQCIKENDDGSCAAFGYCAEERRVWKFGKTCEARYNTCQTYTGRAGQTNSWLGNTLDFRYCNQSNVGCRYVGTEFNLVSKVWNGGFDWNASRGQYSQNSIDSLITVGSDISNWAIKEGYLTSDNGQVKMPLPCSSQVCEKTAGCSWRNVASMGFVCSFEGKSCEIKTGGISCQLTVCDGTDKISDPVIYNPKFENFDSIATNARNWSDEEAYQDSDNRHYRAEGGKTGYALRAITNNNQSQDSNQNGLFSYSNQVTTTPNRNYKVKFQYRGRISAGHVGVMVFGGSRPISNDFTVNQIYNSDLGAGLNSLSVWRQGEFIFNSASFDKIILSIYSWNQSQGDVYFDDFEVIEMYEDCSGYLAEVSNGIYTPAPTSTRIYFDRDAGVCPASATGCTELMKISNATVTAFALAPATNLTPFYTSNTPTYLRKAPSYLNCYYTPDTHLWPDTYEELVKVIANRDLSCNQYSGVCMPSEVGCELYKPMNGDPVVPGIANDIDYCPQVCAGYQIYKQEPTTFVDSKYRQFIADNKAKTCSASYAGCDEFTNLDEIGRGAEKKEYFSNIKACQKPSNDDSAYYTWEGSDTTGYQLRSFNLKKSDKDGAPCTILTYDGSGNPVCRETTPPAGMAIASCTQSDMVTNADCREFYDVNGNVYYRLLSKTVTVSNDCHPYRRTMTQTSFTEAQTDCTNSHGWWKNNSECIYMGVPSEARTCPADASGCRAYTGNRGNNVRKIINVSDFGVTASTTGEWVDGNGTVNDLFISSESTYPGGYSLSNKISMATVKHPVAIQKNKAYVLSFWAKGSADFNLSSIKFTHAPGFNDYFARTKLANEDLVVPSVRVTSTWSKYDLGPVFIADSWNIQSSDNEYLEFTLPGGYTIYLDNVVLKEVTNLTYIVENSWYTPVACDNKLDDSDGAKAKANNTCQDVTAGRCYVGEMLGCAGYTNRAKQEVYLKSFASLCREDAAGCSAFIDTKNNQERTAKTYSKGGDSEVVVPADEKAYLVDDPKFACNSQDKGCQTFGLPILDRNNVPYSYQTVFIKNNPESYTNSLCEQNALWCEEYNSGNSLSYFKDPHGKVCQYQTNASNTSQWIKKGTREACVTTLNQSYGTGYGNIDQKLQPLGLINGANMFESNSDWAGECPAVQSGCSEYVDPLNEVYPEEIGSTTTPSGEKVYHYIKNSALYSIIAKDANGKSIPFTVDILPNPINFHCSIHKQDKNNGGYLYYIQRGFDENDGAFNNCIVKVTAPGAATIKMAKAGVYYKLANSVDTSSCNGEVDFNTGCVLFNNRANLNNSTTTLSARNSYLSFDPYYTFSEQRISERSMKVAPLSETAAATFGGWTNTANDTNTIIKVVPDRTCSQWYSCTSYIKGDGADAAEKFGDKDYCLNIGLCDSMTDDQQCDHLISRAEEIAPTSTSYSTIADRMTNRNKTGYSISGYYPLDQMTQLGQAVLVGNSGFEDVFNEKGKPIGWNPDGRDEIWDSGQFVTVSDKNTAPEGRNFLRVNFVNAVTSEPISVIPGLEYTVSFWANTENLRMKSNAWNSTGVRVCIRRGQFSNFCESTATVSDPMGGFFMRFGLGWTKRQFTFIAATSTVYIGIENYQKLLSSSADPYDDIDPNNLTEADRLSCLATYPAATYPGRCEYTVPEGYSLIDDVQIAPVLKVKDNETLSKTCRLYPAQDSPSCKYIANDQYYYGWYGYCMTEDPVKRGVCLQWWPVDKIAGELVSDYAMGYEDRRPLYYCVERDWVNIKLDQWGSVANFGDDLPEEWKKKIASVAENNREVALNSFSNIPPDFAGFMRTPYIQSMLFTGAFTGFATNKTPYVIPLIVHMYENGFKMDPLNFFQSWDVTACPTNIRTPKEDLTTCVDKSIGEDLEDTSRCMDGGMECSIEICANSTCTDKVIGPCSVPSDGAEPNQTCVLDYENNGDAKYNDVISPDEIDTDDSGGFLGTSRTASGSIRQRLCVDEFDDAQYRNLLLDSINSYGHFDSTLNLNYGSDGDPYSREVTRSTPHPTWGYYLDGVKTNFSNFESRYCNKKVKNLPEVAGYLSDGWQITNEFLGIGSCADKETAWKDVGANGLRYICLYKDTAAGTIRQRVKPYLSAKYLVPPENFMCNICILGMVEKTQRTKDTLLQTCASYNNVFTGNTGGLKGWFAGLLGFIDGDLVYNKTQDRFGGWGIFGFTLNKKTPIVFPLSWTGVFKMKDISTLVQVGIQALNALFDFFGDGKLVQGVGSFGLKLIQDDDPKYKTALPDPNPEIPGDILGYGWYLNTTDMYAAGVIGQLTGEMRVPYCKRLVRAVNTSGQNRARVSRVAPGSAHTETITGGLAPKPASYATDYQPFGAAVQPTNAEEPAAWDSKTNNASMYSQPLFFEAPLYNLQPPYQARAGGFFSEIYTATCDNIAWDPTAAATTLGVNNLQNLFVQTYDTYVWNWGARHKESNGDDHSPTDPDLVKCNGCTPLEGGKYVNDTGSLADQVGHYVYNNVDKEGKGSIVGSINPQVVSSNINNKLVKLQFTLRAEMDQLPIKSYVVFWGDGQSTAVSGVELNDKPNTSNPFTLFHTYDLNKLRNKGHTVGTEGSTNTFCCYSGHGQNCYNQKLEYPKDFWWYDDNNKKVRVYISVMDNWDKLNYCNPASITSPENMNFKEFSL